MSSPCGAPNVELPRPGCVAVADKPPARPAVGEDPAGDWPLRPGICEPPAPGMICCPKATVAKSSPVIGSLYFLRMNRCSTSTLRFGGYAPTYFRWNSPIAWTYCLPRKTSSSSFSRWADCFQTGRATVIMTAMMLIAMSSAAIAYPC